jgi:hypothetical protein
MECIETATGGSIRCGFWRIQWTDVDLVDRIDFIDLVDLIDNQFMAVLFVRFV